MHVRRSALPFARFPSFAYRDFQVFQASRAPRTSLSSLSSFSRFLSRASTPSLATSTPALGLCLAVLLLAPSPAQAGGDFDWLLARQRSLAEDGRLTASDALQTAPTLNGAEFVIGSTRALPMPRAALGAAGNGVGTGARVGYTLVDRPDGVRLHLGAAVHRVPDHGRPGSGLPEASLEGFELSVPLGPGRVYASQQRRHWGPAWMGSLILDGAAAPVAALGWRKDDDQPFASRWLNWLGPWSADFFGGRLSGHQEPRHPWLIGMRVTAQPLTGLQIGLSRTIQWGGSGRDESWSSLWRALRGNDNVGDAGVTKGNEPGNQMAGYDIRYAHALGARHVLAGYAQAIGEDERNHKPYKFLVTVGLELSGRFSAASTAPWRGYQWRVFGEWSDTGMRHAFGTHQAGAYRHAAFAGGYANYRQPLGFPAGGDVTLGSLGAIVDGPGASLIAVLHSGHALRGAQMFDAGDSIRGLSLGAQMPWRGWRLGASLDMVRASSMHRQQAGQLWAAWDW